MEALFVGGLVGATSLLAAWLARGAGRRRWKTALGRMLDVLGLGVLFFAANVAVGVAAVLAVRAATGTFVSANLVDDETLAALSLLQGLLFAGLLRPTGRRRPGRKPRGGAPPTPGAGPARGVDGRRSSV